MESCSRERRHAVQNVDVVNLIVLILTGFEHFPTAFTERELGTDMSHGDLV